MAVKLAPRIRRTRDFGGVRIATTGLPLTFASEVAGLATKSQEEQTAWLASRFIEVLPRCVFVVPDDTPRATAAGLESVDGSDLDLDSVSDLFVWVCGLESQRPLERSAMEQTAPSPSLN